MNAKQADNLRTLIRHMETKVSRILNMKMVFSEGFRIPDGKCGTPACALGECTAIPELRDQGMTNFISCIAELRDRRGPGPVFGLDSTDSNRIFGEPHLNVWHRANVSAHEWAAEARKVLARNGYSMDTTPNPEPFKAFMAKALEPVAVEA